MGFSLSFLIGSFKCFEYKIEKKNACFKTILLQKSIEITNVIIFRNVKLKLFAREKFSISYQEKNATEKFFFKEMIALFRKLLC